jgi:hypothetical protein
MEPVAMHLDSVVIAVAVRFVQSWENPVRNTKSSVNKLRTVFRVNFEFIFSVFRLGSRNRTIYPENVPINK